MGILRITMRKMSSQSVSGAFTAFESTQRGSGVNESDAGAIAGT
jgi:hypothetical protein